MRLMLIWSHDAIILPAITWHHVTPPDIMWHHLSSHGIMWHHLTSHGIMWHHLTSHGIMWHHLTSHVTSCDTTWHHVTSCDTTWHHVTSQTSSPFPPSGHKKGFLFKKKKVDNVWQSRFFVLDGDTLRYFKKITVSLHCCLTLFKKLLVAFSYDLCHGIHFSIEKVAWSMNTINYLVLQFHWWMMWSHLCVICVVCASLRCHVRQACGF